MQVYCLCGLREHEVTPDGTTGLRACCQDDPSAHRESSNSFSVLTGEDDGPPELMDSDEET